MNISATGTETIAVPQSDGSYRLHGYKWFSSATDANMTLTLARVENEEKNVIEVRDRERERERGGGFIKMRDVNE